MEFQMFDATKEMSDKINQKWKTFKAPLVIAGTGSGKTFGAIAAVGAYNEQAHIIVVAPKSKLEDNSWNTSVDAYNRAMDTQLTCSAWTVDRYSSGKHMEEIQIELAEMSHNHRPVIVIFDEVHTMTSMYPTITTRAKALLNTGTNSEVDKILTLSATPVGNSLLDEVALLIINGFYTNKTDFQKRHVVHVDPLSKQPIVKNIRGIVDKTLFEDYQTIENNFKNIQVQIESKIIMPKVISKDIPLEIDTKHLRTFKFLKKYNVNEKMTERQCLALIRKMHRQGFFDSASTRIALEAEVVAQSLQKGQALVNIVKNVYHSNEPHPILIFYTRLSELNAIELYLKSNIRNFPNLQFAYINGQHKDLDFAKDNNPHKVVLIQYTSGAEGIECKTAYTTIFYGATYKSRSYEQSKGRNVRAGMTHTITHYRPITRKSYDEAAWSMTDNKVSFSKTQMLDTMNAILDEDEGQQ